MKNKSFKLWTLMATVLLALTFVPTTQAGPLDNVSVDLYGNYRDTGSGVWGEGVGISYDVGKHVALGVEATKIHGFDGEIIDDLNVAANVYVKAPFKLLGIQPYGLAGIGRSVSVADWDGHVGGGVERELFKHVCVFAEGRRMFYFDSDEGEDTTQARVGIRLRF